jgi:glycosyltransferase involved in cell wall biosynthesis
MKLNWFSPIAPAKTDIAHYTRRLLPGLSQLAQITLWTDQPSWDRELEKFASVRQYRLTRMPWVELNRADMTFYNIGNNPDFHGSIWQVSRQLAGTVVLHDFRLHHFFDGLFRVKFRDRNSYLAVMTRHYGEEGRRDARICYDSGAKNIDYMAERYPLTEFALENAVGVLVHNMESFEILARKKSWPLAYAPLPFPSRTEGNAKQQRRDDRIRLILFGYIGRNRRLNSVLRAIAESEERNRFKLDIYGSILDDEKKLRGQLSSLGLHDQVTLHGFTAEDRLDRALNDSDLAINLRYPSMGEASGSQLRIWSHGLPSLVSKVGWYSSLPENVVAFVRTDENEVSDIRSHLTAFIKDPKRFADMGARGRQELETKHSPASYVDCVAQLTEKAMRFRAEAAQLALSERAARVSAAWLNSDVAETGLRRAANEICALQRGTTCGSL